MKYILAKSAAEALEALLAEEGKARIIAGGSDVMVDMEAGKLAPQTLVDITTADDMKGIRIQDDQLIIGAAVTLTEIARSPLIRQYFPSLCKGAGSVGSLQIRTLHLVGTLSPPSPAADCPPWLLRLLIQDLSYCLRMAFGSWQWARCMPVSAKAL